MSKKPSRRKKAPPAERRPQTFKIVVEAQEMIVSYEPNWIADTAHFEYRSPHKPPRRIPVSDTGYLSHFAAKEEIEAAASPQDFAREIALALLRADRAPDDEDGGQLRLF